jgi:hypothetical protein
MPAFGILEPILAILVLGFVLSQCVIPELVGQPWFPILRRISRVRQAIAVAREEAETTHLTTKLQTMKGKETTNAPDQTA